MATPYEQILIMLNKQICIINIETFQFQLKQINSIIDKVVDVFEYELSAHQVKEIAFVVDEQLKKRDQCEKDIKNLEDQLSTLEGLE